MRSTFVLAVLLAGLVRIADAVEPYSVPGLGTIQLELPQGWRVQQKPGPVSLYLQIQPESGDAFLLQVTSYWYPQEKLTDLTLASVKERLEGIAKPLLPSAVETEVKLNEIKGGGASGYYLTLTARETAKPNNVKYMSQGLLLTPVGLTFFTLLHREPAIPERERALALVAGAIHSRDAALPADRWNDALRVIPEKDRYVLWVPVSRVYVELPRGNLMQMPVNVGGATSNPRYFYFINGSFNLSGWLEPAEKFAGVEKFWEEEQRARDKRLPPPSDVVFKKVAGWDAIVYEMTAPTGNNLHIRAHRVQSGTWVDVHLSLTSSRPTEQIRTALETFLQAILVRDR